MADKAFGEMETQRLNSSRKIRDELAHKIDDAVSRHSGHEIFTERSMMSLEWFVVNG